MPRKCSFFEANRQCRRIGHGNPPICDFHDSIMDNGEDEIVDAVVGRIVENPTAQRVLNSLLGYIDRAAQGIDWTAAKVAPNGHHQPVQPPPRQRQAPPRRPEPPREDPRVILGIPVGVKVTQEMLKKRYRELALLYHPDKGGNTEAMQRITRARDQLLATL
jgi:hypothetical protein